MFIFVKYFTTYYYKTYAGIREMITRTLGRGLYNVGLKLTCAYF